MLHFTIKRNPLAIFFLAIRGYIRRLRVYELIKGDANTHILNEIY